MAAEFSAEEIIEITGARLAQGMMPDGVGRIATDTRKIAEGEWYLALSGEKFDGHDFIGDAFSAALNFRRSFLRAPPLSARCMYSRYCCVMDAMGMS